MANVAERLRVLYGDDARMMVSNRPSGGTAVQLQIPLQSAEAAQDSPPHFRKPAPIPCDKNPRKWE